MTEDAPVRLSILGVVGPTGVLASIASALGSASCQVLPFVRAPSRDPPRAPRSPDPEARAIRVAFVPPRVGPAARTDTCVDGDGDGDIALPPAPRSAKRTSVHPHVHASTRPNRHYPPAAGHLSLVSCDPSGGPRRPSASISIISAPVSDSSCISIGDPVSKALAY